MTIKYVLAAALIVPLMTVASTAQTVDQHGYLGGPKSTIPHTARPIVSTGEAFAMTPATVPVPRVRRSHVYSGGPQTVVPHSF